MPFVALKAELVELINADYADFIGLSTTLVGVDRSLEDIRGPMLHLHKEIAAAREQIQGVVEHVEAKLKDRALLREKRVRKERKYEK